MTTSEPIHFLFEKQVDKTPDALAVIAESHSVTYDELNQKANQLARYLKQKGVKNEVMVGVCLSRSAQLLSAVFGVLKAGGAYVPLDASHPQERLDFILTDTNAPVLITTSSFKQQFSHYTGTLIVLDEVDETIDSLSVAPLDVVVRPNDLAYVIYTSGTTGRPKGVMVEHHSVVNYSAWFEAYAHSKQRQRIDFSSLFIFDMAVTCSIAPLMLGLTVVVCPETIRKDTRAYLNHLALYSVNCIKITPSFFKVLLLEAKNRTIELPDLKAIILGGEQLSTLDCEQWLSIYPHHVLYNEYGPTEATVAVSQQMVHLNNVSDFGPVVPIGKPSPFASLYVLDEHLEPVLPSQPGELYIAGPCLARGYLNQSTLTQAQFINKSAHLGPLRLYKTGDICRKLEDETFIYEGRVDTQIKIRGFRIEPGEIESVLTGIDVIESAIVLAREDKQKEKRLIAYYVLNSAEKDIEIQQIKAHLKTTLPDYMIPVSFVRVEVFPLTQNGKLDQAALPTPQYMNRQHFLPPSSETECQVADIWSDELDVKPIGLRDDFFELGGDSLIAARIVLKLNALLDKNISMQDFYAYTTIEKLLPILNERSKPQATVSPSSLYERRRHLPLSDFQFMLWLSDIFAPKLKSLNVTSRKRLEGRLNIERLNAAFEQLISHNEVLSYRFSKLAPVQRIHKLKAFELTVIDLSQLDEAAIEKRLEQSLDALASFYPWKKRRPMLLAFVFHLPGQRTEIQLSMPHYIGDDVAPDIIFSQLSSLYLESEPVSRQKKDMQYKKYIASDRQYFHAHAQRDMLFWEDYLGDAALFTFPEKHILKGKEMAEHTYSTYHPIPMKSLERLKRFCAVHRVSLHDGICAALRLALDKCSDASANRSSPIVINLVKSTRSQGGFEHALGCFLRLEPIKISWEKSNTLASLAMNVHRAVIQTHPYQQCTGMIKLASIKAMNAKRALWLEKLIQTGIYAYSRLLSPLKLNYQYMRLCARLSPVEKNKDNQFLINLNIRRNFISGSQSAQQFCGLEAKKTARYQPDLVNVNQVFDICFMRDTATDKPYVVISTNLAPAYRSKIAKTIVQVMDEEARVQDLLVK